MDNLCHGLVGAALAEAGLKRRTALGYATLVIAANFPDIDAIAIPLGHNLAFRRGLTHGVLAHLLLPFLLTALMLLWDRLVRRRLRPDHAERPIPAQILLLATIGIWTHPFLDWTNTYGMRWLMPFRDEWFYGDAIFIVDPWMWLMLGIGVIVARMLGRRGAEGERRGRRVAATAVAMTAFYVAGMLGTAWMSRWLVRDALTVTGVHGRSGLMVGPQPLNPFRRQVVAEDGEVYRVGSLRWTPRPRLSFDGPVIPKGDEDPRARMAANAPEASAFMHWARFPFYRMDGDSAMVIADARYSRMGADSWATVRVRVDGIAGNGPGTGASPITPTEAPPDP